MLTCAVIAFAVSCALLAALAAARPAKTSGGPYSAVVDNAQSGRFSASGLWSTSSRGESRFGRNYALARSGRAEPARFRARIPSAGWYTVSARWPADPAHNAATPIGVRTVSGTEWTRVNQQRNGGRWVKLGTYRMAAGDRYNIVVARGGRGSGRVVADAVMVAEASAPGRTVRGPDQMVGAPIYDRATVTRYARSVGGTRFIREAIPHYYKLAPRVGIAPDVLVAQAIVETGAGHYGGDSKPWNMAGIKKGGDVGDEPRDFERPTTAYEGVRMHVNHMAAYMGKEPIGRPHDRYHDARAAQSSRGWWVRRISQLGGGIWATDPAYAGKIRRVLDEMRGS